MKSDPNLPEIKGWCPGALRPMLSGDGLVVRIRAPEGRLDQGQAQGVATLARRFGNGQLDLSARANLQIRGVTSESHPPLIDGLRALGLIDADLAAETRRNIVTAPFWSEGDDTITLSRALAHALASPGAPDTPGKFGYAIDCGATPVLQATSADIRIERAPAGAPVGTLIVRPDGSATGAPATPDTAVALALSLARWFLESGGAPEGRGRMARHLAAGAAPPDIFAEITAPVAKGPPPAPGPTGQGTLAALEFGQTDAETLAALAGHGPLRLTPWRMILVEGARRLPPRHGLILAGEDPLLSVIACPGAPSCPQAKGPSRPIARALARDLPRGTLLHVSGCAKGCAHPGAAARTLVATPDGYDLILNGRAGDTPTRTGLSPSDLPALLRP